MHIDRVESRTHERCRHLVLTVYSLLPENSNSRLLASNQWGGDIFGRIEVETNIQTRIFAVEDAVVLFPRRFRIIAERLQPVTRLRPFSLHAGTVHSEDDLVVAADAQSVIRIDTSNHRPCGIATVQDRLDFAQAAVSHLYYCAEFLIKQLPQNLTFRPGQMKRRPEPASEHHFDDRDQKPAIRAVMVGKDQTFFSEFLDCLEKISQSPRVV